MIRSGVLDLVTVVLGVLKVVVDFLIWFLWPLSIIHYFFFKLGVLPLIFIHYFQFDLSLLPISADSAHLDSFISVIRWVPDIDLAMVTYTFYFSYFLYAPAGLWGIDKVNCLLLSAFLTYGSPLGYS